MKIAISGLTASGKTALAKELAKRLEGHVLFIPTFKDIVASMGLSLEEYEVQAEKDPSIDRQFDDKIKEIFSSEKNIILASWLAIWTVDADLKVFLSAPLQIRAERAAKREGLSIDEAIEYVRSRDERNRKRYLSVYGVDIFQPSEIADIVLNNSSMSIEQEAEAVECILAVKYKNTS